MFLPQLSSLCMFNVQKSLQSVWYTADTVISSRASLKIRWVCSCPVVRDGIKLRRRKWRKGATIAFAGYSSSGTSRNLESCSSSGRPQGLTSDELNYSKKGTYIPHFLCFFLKLNPNTSHSVEQSICERREAFFCFQAFSWFSAFGFLLPAIVFNIVLCLYLKPFFYSNMSLQRI